MVLIKNIKHYHFVFNYANDNNLKINIYYFLTNQKKKKNVLNCIHKK